METKSGAQKLSEFSSQLGSQLGESQHTATRLDGESVQGQSTAQFLSNEAKGKRKRLMIISGVGLVVLIVAIWMSTMSTCGDETECIPENAGVDDDEAPPEETPAEPTDETPPTKTVDKATSKPETPAKAKDGKPAVTEKPVAPTKATAVKPKSTKPAVTGKGPKVKAPKAAAKSAKAKPAKAKAGKAKPLAKATKGGKAKGKKKPH
jgi:outer membrane biosynthesis protein TonB